MVCEKFKKLEDPDRLLYQAKVLHAIQSDDELFDYGINLIAMGLRKGIFDNVRFGTEALKPDPEETKDY